MNKNNLVIFGDSWAQGAELTEKQKTFGELVAEKLNLKYSNYAQPASSITHLVIQLKDFLKKLNDCHERTDDWAAIFFLTGKERYLSWLNDDWTFHTPHGGCANWGRPTGQEALDLTNLYYKYFFSDQQADLHTNLALITVQSICQKYNIQDFYIQGWQTFDLWPEVNCNKIYKSGLTTCADFLELKQYNSFGKINFDNKNPYMYPNKSHPNQQGHQLIADRLVEWIASA